MNQNRASDSWIRLLKLNYFPSVFFGGFTHHMPSEFCYVGGLAFEEIIKMNSARKGRNSLKVPLSWLVTGLSSLSKEQMDYKKLTSWQLETDISIKTLRAHQTEKLNSLFIEFQDEIKPIAI